MKEIVKVAGYGMLCGLVTLACCILFIGWLLLGLTMIFEWNYPILGIGYIVGTFLLAVWSSYRIDRK